MDYETAKFKRDTVNRNGKEVTQIRVTGLSVNSKFKDNEELIILSKDDFTKFENEYNTNKGLVQRLKQQLKNANFEIDRLKNATPEPIPEPITENPKYYNELITAKDEISNLKDTINNRNGLLLNTQTSIENLINELTTEITKLYDTEITEANTVTQKNIQVILDTITDAYKTMFDYNEELENIKANHNNTIDNTSIITRALRKDSLKLQLDNSKLQSLENQLKNLNDNCIKYENIVKPVEIPASKITEIKLNAKSNKFDISELFIDTGNQDENEENITLTPGVVNNGNGNQD